MPRPSDGTAGTLGIRDIVRSVAGTCLLLLAVAVAAAPADEARPRHGSLTVLHKVPLQQKAVALTVDLGTTATVPSVNGILKTLDRHDIKATWFVTGWFVRTHPDLAKKLVADGHHLANHTDTHPDCTRVNSARIERELRVVEQLLAAHDLRINEPKHFRPPFGKYNRSLVDTAAVLGYRTVIWSATSADYAPRANPERCRQTILKRVGPGGIILVHATSATNQMMEGLVAALHKQGYTVVPLADLLHLAHQEMAQKAKQMD